MRKSENEKPKYDQPKLRRLGSLSDLTRAVGARQTNDGTGGGQGSSPMTQMT